MVIGTTEWIIISYFAGVAGGLLMGWLMWKDGATKLMEGSQSSTATGAHSATHSTSSEKGLGA